MTAVAQKLIPESLPRPQVLMLVADEVLEGVYRDQMQSDDFCIEWCEKPRNWEQTLQNFVYDVIILDFSFFRGGRDRLERLHQVMKLSPQSQVIVLSDSEDAQTAISAFHMGVADYFLKPTNPETLVWAIKKAVQLQNVQLTNELLNEDMQLFNLVHQLNAETSDETMRELAAKHLHQLLDCQGMVWVSEDGQTQIGLTGDEAKTKLTLSAFLEGQPDVIPASFESNLTSHPENWVDDNVSWIPMRFPWMGGFFAFGVNRENDDALQSRLEFVVRNLEGALENQQRYTNARKLSYVDDLTGLYNSRYLEIDVAAAEEKYKKDRQPFSVLFIDIDKFKSVNDTHGHLVGSQLLIQLAKLLKKTLRQPDHLFRYGGDEFIVLLYDTDTKEAMNTAERLRTDVEKHLFLAEEKKLHITLSIGVATFPTHGKDKSAVLKMADDAMYAGKKSGRNKVFLATTEKE